MRESRWRDTVLSNPGPTGIARPIGNVPSMSNPVAMTNHRESIRPDLSTGLQAGASGFAFGDLPLAAASIHQQPLQQSCSVDAFLDQCPGLAYPGTRPVGSFILAAGNLLPLTVTGGEALGKVHDGSTVSDLDSWLRQHGHTGLQERVACLAYGSNLHPKDAARVAGDDALIAVSAVTLGLAATYCMTPRRDGQYPAGLTGSNSSYAERHGFLLVTREQALLLDKKEGQRGGFYSRAVATSRVGILEAVLPDGTIWSGPVPMYVQGPPRPLASVDGVPALLSQWTQSEFARSPKTDLADDCGLNVTPVETLPRWSTTPIPVFSYGTLQPGEQFWPGIEHLVDLAEPVSIAGRRSPTPIGYPGVTLDSESTAQGALLWASPGRHLELLDICDRIEGHPDLYERHLVRVTDGRLAWVYLYRGA